MHFICAQNIFAHYFGSYQNPLFSPSYGQMRFLAIFSWHTSC